jgi:hypothetical protein
VRGFRWFFSFRPAHGSQPRAKELAGTLSNGKEVGIAFNRLRSHAAQLPAGARSAIGTRSGVNWLVNTLNGQSARNSLYSKCADSQNSLTQKLQFADFFAATFYAAKRKKKWRIFRVVRRFRSGPGSLLV